MSARYLDEAPVFERVDGVIYECVDVSPGHVHLRPVNGFLTEPMIYARTPRDIRGKTKPVTRIARELLAIARGAR